MNSEIDVTVIIINYNSFELLHNCLETIKEKTKDISIQVIVADNSSTEGNVEQVTGHFKFVEVIKNAKNLGFAKANNLAARKAKGKYLLLLNNDTLLLENSIKYLADYVQELSGDFIVGCKLLNKDGSDQNSALKFPNLFRHFSATFFLDKIFFRSEFFSKKYLYLNKKNKPINVDSIFGAFIFIPKTTFDKIKGFDERFFFYYEDIDLCYRLNEIGGKVIYNPKTTIIHIGGSSASKNLLFEMKNKMISRIQYAQKHFKGFYQISFFVVEYCGLAIRFLTTLILGIILFNKQYLLKSYYSLRLLFIYPKNLFG
ncbi:MAG: glycosyltransferase family 2 protein [Ignavibacteria bacterium]|nr:glycosyltransferase family 2 protein [Ignavibacteria bacterium]